MWRIYERSIVNNSVKEIAKENPNQYMIRESANRSVPNGIQWWWEKTLNENNYSAPTRLIMDFMQNTIIFLLLPTI